MRTTKEVTAQKVLLPSGVRYYFDGSYHRIPMNGKIKVSRNQEIIKIYGYKKLIIETDDVFGDRVLSSDD